MNESTDDAKNERPQLFHENDFEDEAPGAYLAELGPTALNPIWASINLALTLVAGGLSWAAQLSVDSNWFPVARLAWIALPVSMAILVIITIWQVASEHTRKPRRGVRFTLRASVAAVAAWCLLSWAAPVLLEERPPAPRADNANTKAAHEREARSTGGR